MKDEDLAWTNRASRVWFDVFVRIKSVIIFP
jgi:hypothetical protein